MALTELSCSQVMAWRMRRHGLCERAPVEEALDAVGRICGLHAQVMSSAELALWARVEELGREWVQEALWQERSLVKTWAMRGTLHLLPAREYALWQSALSSYDHYLKPAWSRAFGLSPERLEELLAAVASALEGEPLTREQLAAAVSESTGSAELGEKVLGSWGVYLKPASFRGLLIFGPSAGTNVRFTRPNGWLEPSEPVEQEAALAEVTRRYLSAHGPATREDLFRWWGGGTAARAGRRIEVLGEEVEQVSLEGKHAWMLRDQVGEAAGSEPHGVVRLLPAFDQYVVGATRRAPALLAAEHAPRVYRKAGWISPVLLVDGRMAGVWRHERKGRRLLVDIEPFEKQPKRVTAAAAAEASRLAGFLGGELTLSWSG
ncbi:MAG TPA: winged helix DNA-binding domain-containing protein [Thermoleophilaceae bacterium]|nr:winged helix DNA-binding domain-containing protein [Thermoleophilaceae bacterium]